MIPHKAFFEPRYKLLKTLVGDLERVLDLHLSGDIPKTKKPLRVGVLHFLECAHLVKEDDPTTLFKFCTGHNLSFYDLAAIKDTPILIALLSISQNYLYSLLTGHHLVYARAPTMVKEPSWVLFEDPDTGEIQEGQLLQHVLHRFILEYRGQLKKTSNVWIPLKSAEDPFLIWNSNPHMIPEILETLKWVRGRHHNDRAFEQTFLRLFNHQLEWPYERVHLEQGDGVSKSF